MDLLRLRRDGDRCCQARTARALSALMACSLGQQMALIIAGIPPPLWGSVARLNGPASYVLVGGLGKPGSSHLGVDGATRQLSSLAVLGADSMAKAWRMSLRAWVAACECSHGIST